MSHTLCDIENLIAPPPILASFPFKILHGGIRRPSHRSEDRARIDHKSWTSPYTVINLEIDFHIAIRKLRNFIHIEYIHIHHFRFSPDTTVVVSFCVTIDPEVRPSLTSWLWLLYSLNPVFNSVVFLYVYRHKLSNRRRPTINNNSGFGMRLNDMFHLNGAAQRNTSSADNRHVRMFTLPDERVGTQGNTGTKDGYNNKGRRERLIWNFKLILNYGRKQLVY